MTCTQAELNEVLEDDDDEAPKPAPPAVAPSPAVTPRSGPTTPSGPAGIESRLVERIDMYQTAISNAKAAGESSKARRYDRGLKVKCKKKYKKGKDLLKILVQVPCFQKVVNAYQMRSHKNTKRL